MLYEMVERRREKKESSCQTFEAPQQYLPNSNYDGKIERVKEELEKVRREEVAEGITRWRLEEEEKVRGEMREEMQKQFDRWKLQEQNTLENARKQMKVQQQEFLASYTKKVEDLVAFQSKQTEQISKLKEENRKLLKAEKQHRCTDSE